MARGAWGRRTAQGESPHREELWEEGELQQRDSNKRELTREGELHEVTARAR